MSYKSWYVLKTASMAISKTLLKASESYAKGYICDCRAIGKYGTGTDGPCVDCSCPANAVCVDADEGVFHSDTFPFVIEDFQCLCDTGFFDTLDGADAKNPNCVADPCATNNGDCGDNSDCDRIDESQVEVEKYSATIIRDFRIFFQICNFSKIENFGFSIFLLLQNRANVKTTFQIFKCFFQKFQIFLFFKILRFSYCPKF